MSNLEKLMHAGADPEKKEGVVNTISFRGYVLDGTILEKCSEGAVDEILSNTESGQDSLRKVFWKDENNEEVSFEQIAEQFEELGSWDKLLKKYPQYQNFLFDIINADMNYQPILHKGVLLSGKETIAKSLMEGGDPVVRIIRELPKEAIISKPIMKVEEQGLDEISGIAA
jgi:hypothetical protein